MQASPCQPQGFNSELYPAPTLLLLTLNHPQVFCIHIFSPQHPRRPAYGVPMCLYPLKEVGYSKLSTTLQVVCLTSWGVEPSSLILNIILLHAVQPKMAQINPRIPINPFDENKSIFQCDSRNWLVIESEGSIAYSLIKYGMTNYLFFKCSKFT